MKHITSKLLSLLLCLAMLMSMVPAADADVETEVTGGENTPTETNGGASEQDDATTNAAKVGEVGYTTLADAITAAKDGDTVTLLADRTEDVTEVRVYSNLPEVSLYKDGHLVETKKGDKVFVFNVPITGKHSIEARAGAYSSVILVNKVA